MNNAAHRVTAQLDALTGSRFVAAYAILILHGQAFGYTLPAWLNLAQAVSYFFVLSGFVIAYRYPTLPTRNAIAAFYWARLARVWPVHFVCLVAGIAVVPAAFWLSADGVTFSILGLQVVLLNAWVPIERFVFGFNHVAWTISVECFFYLVYPILLMHLNTTWRSKLGATALLLVALTLLSYWTDIPALGDPSRPNDVSALALLYANPLARLFEFTLGATAAMLWRRYRGRMRMRMSTATLIEVALLCAIAVDLYWAGHRASVWASEIGSRAFDWRVLTSTPIGTGACLLYAVLIVSLADGSGLIAKALALRIPMLLGESSYSLYMIQYVMLVTVTHHLHGLERLSVAARVTFGFAAIIGIALLLWYFVERPARRWLVRHQPTARQTRIARTASRPQTPSGR